MFLTKGTVSLFTCLCLLLFKGDVSGEGDSLFTCLFLFKGDVSGDGDSQSVYLSVSVSV